MRSRTKMRGTCTGGGGVIQRKKQWLEDFAVLK
jgi:hypothetical protein